MPHLSGEVAEKCAALKALAEDITWAKLARDDAEIRKLYGRCSALNDGKLEAYNGLADRLSGAAQSGSEAK